MTNRVKLRLSAALVAAAVPMVAAVPALAVAVATNYQPRSTHSWRWGLSFPTVVAVP